MSSLVNGISETQLWRAGQSSSSSLSGTGGGHKRGWVGARSDPRMRKTNSACRACLGNFVVGSPPLSGWFRRWVFPRRTGEAGPAGQDGVAAGPSAGCSRSAATVASAAIYEFVQVGGQPCSWLLGLDLPWLVSWKGVVRAWVTLENPNSSQGQPAKSAWLPCGSLSWGLPETGSKPGCRDRAET